MAIKKYHLFHQTNSLTMGAFVLNTGNDKPKCITFDTFHLVHTWLPRTDYSNSIDLSTCINWHSIRKNFYLFVSSFYLNSSSFT